MDYKRLIDGRFYTSQCLYGGQIMFVFYYHAELIEIIEPVYLIVIRDRAVRLQGIYSVVEEFLCIVINDTGNA